MSTEVIFKFSDVTIYDPLTVQSDVEIEVEIYNPGETDLTGVGLYILPATNLGSVGNEADFSPETDFQDLVTYGEAVRIGDEITGGLKLLVPQNVGADLEVYVSRVAGNLVQNKIAMQDIPAGGSVVVGLTLETPPSASTRRLYFNLAVE